VSEPDGAAAKDKKTAATKNTTAAADTGPKETLSYEQARDKLAAVVKRLESGGLTLEQSLELWERGERLAAVCEEWLDGARARLATAMAQGDDSGPQQADAAATGDHAPF
jgi:exodeoxyribonuclease VII small subunit